GHLSEVDHHRAAGDVATEGYVEGMLGPADLLRGEHVAQRHQLTLHVRDLDTGGRFSRDGSEYPHLLSRHRVRDVAMEARDPGDLHSRSQFQLEPGDGRADGAVDE